MRANYAAPRSHATTRSTVSRSKSARPQWPASSHTNPFILHAVAAAADAAIIIILRNNANPMWTHRGKKPHAKMSVRAQRIAMFAAQMMKKTMPSELGHRYCELTSWMAEIKCSHREIPVRARESGGAQTSTTTLEKQQYLPAAAASDDLNQPTVITKATDGRSSSPAVAERFETQIYDLRALTNYTFHVHVARFLGEPSAELANQQSRNVSAGRQLQPLTARQRPSRRLEAPGDGQEARGRVEMTKAFSAEAVKCLADSSEVLVNTGRFFGGRISVEGQQDARCQLLGNKSSEQSAYSFRIDHEACRSKITVSVAAADGSTSSSCRNGRICRR